MTDDPVHDTARSIALLLHDGLRFTPQPLTAEQQSDLLWGLRMIAMGATNERELFRSMLNHRWVTTGPFDHSDMASL